MNQISPTDTQLKTAEAIELLGAGPREDELASEFAARVILATGARAYSLVIARIQYGRYPQPDTEQWRLWERGAIIALRRGHEPDAIVTHACGMYLGEGHLSCTRQRGHNGPHGENY